MYRKIQKKRLIPIKNAHKGKKVRHDTKNYRKQMKHRQIVYARKILGNKYKFENYYQLDVGIYVYTKTTMTIFWVCIFGSDGFRKLVE